METQEATPDGNVRTTIILATAVVRIQDRTNISTPQRALLDSGAQCSLISKSCAQRLGLRQIRCHLPLRGVSGSVGVLDRKVQVYIRPWFESPILLPVELFLIDDWETQHPPVAVRWVLPPLNGRNLADENFDTPNRVDMLLGADIWASIVGPTIYRANVGAMMQDSMLGFLALGRFALSDQNALFATVLNLMANNEPALENDLLLNAIKRFWYWEEMAETIPWTPEEQAVEKLFQETHYRNKDGRYVIRIPIRPNMPSLGDSRAIALRRFYQLERRLQANHDLRQKYIQAMREEIEHGYMEKAWGHPTGDMVYYIPHHCVGKKFRIVNDASCRTSNGLSLNDIQMVGPKIQHDLADQIMRFRRHKIAVVADVKKMFKQVKVDPSQWDLQRIFWRESPNDPLQEYWLTSVIFGLASALHCSCRAMIQCARDNAHVHPIAAKTIESDFYVDDGLFGAESIEAAMKLCKEIDTVLKSGGFEGSV